MRLLPVWIPRRPPPHVHSSQEEAPARPQLTEGAAEPHSGVPLSLEEDTDP